MNQTRVLVIDDHPFFRGGVVTWLKQQPDLVCCGEAHSAAAARLALVNCQPHLVLLDLDLPDGVEFIAEIRCEYPTVQLIVFSTTEEPAVAHRALSAGARGCLVKSEPPESVRAALNAVMRGEVYTSRALSARLLHNDVPAGDAKPPDLKRLSPREIQVFQLIGASCRSGEIALRLKISPKTVDTYRENLKQKLSLPHAEALVHAATRWVQKGELPTQLVRRRKVEHPVLECNTPDQAGPRRA